MSMMPGERLAKQAAPDAKDRSGLHRCEPNSVRTLPSPFPDGFPIDGNSSKVDSSQPESRDHRRGRHDHPFPRTFSRRHAQQACIGLDSSKLKEKESDPLSVYNFCFCLPRPRAIEEYLSKSAPFSAFAYFYYTALSKNYR
jgi:hypothetical protein